MLIIFKNRLNMNLKAIEKAKMKKIIIFNNKSELKK